MTMIDNNKHDLFFELEAFHPRWQTRYRTIKDAAIAARVEDMYTDWLMTDQGRRYTDLYANVPDTLERVRLEQEALARLPYHL